MGDTGSLALGGAIAALAVMTETEVLLIVIGGIFVIEALSVLIQVFSFQLFRRRVFLMAPIHHHFELEAWSETKIMLRFWIVAAACGAIGFTLYRLTFVGEARGRPLPPGPYLVVGLARSGEAAALALRARGEEVIGATRARASGRRSPRPPEGFATPASKSSWMRQATRLPPAPGRSSRAPACPRTRPRSSGAGPRRRVLGELELAWRLSPTSSSR